MYKLRSFYTYSLIILFGVVFYIPFLGGVHLFDWDEINFAESAREMIVSGNYLDIQINFRPFWEKPPLFTWLQVLTMKLLGVNEYAARLPNAFCGILSLIAIFNIGMKFRDEKFAWLWLLAFAGSILPFLYFKSGIIDPWFNLFIFLGIVKFAFYLDENSNRLKNLGLSALFIGLAILTKGPVAMLIFILSFLIFLILKKFIIKTRFTDILFFSVILAFTGGIWFILQILKGNFLVVQDFIRYQLRLFSTEDAGHGGFLLYHFVVLFVGVFPASVFAISGFKVKTNNKFGMRLWMLILFWTVLVLFTIVKTKIVHYSSLCYFPLSFFAALFLYEFLYNKAKLYLIFKIIILCLAALFGILMTVMPLLERFKTTIIENEWIKDPFTNGNLLAEVKWTGFEPLIGLGFIFAVYYFLNRSLNNPRKLVTGLFISTILFTYLSIIIITPRIEAYSQRAAIEFYKSVAGEDAYITTLGFKSYAHLYYGKVKPAQNPDQVKIEWLLEGKIDKPVYFVFKINRKKSYLEKYPQLKLLYEKNGFVFARRSIFNNTQ